MCVDGQTGVLSSDKSTGRAVYKKERRKRVNLGRKSRWGEASRQNDYETDQGSTTERVYTPRESLLSYWIAEVQSKLLLLAPGGAKVMNVSREAEEEEGGVLQVWLRAGSPGAVSSSPSHLRVRTQDCHYLSLSL